jgi:TonB-dependent starch-binding outer membrane protein SusC
MHFKALFASVLSVVLRKRLLAHQTILAMRLTAFLVLCGLLHASAGTVAQISLSFKGAPLQQVLKSIKKQTDYTFFSNTVLMRESKPVTINVSNVSLEEALSICFRDQPFTYSIEGNIISVKFREISKKIITPTLDFPPPITMRGKVANEKGEPSAGVTIAVKGTEKITATDNNGDFILNNIDGKAVLIISGANIEMLEIKVNDRANINITVVQKVSELDQTVIIGYGTSTKRLNTGSVATVKSADIEKQPIANPLSALQGRMAGVFVQNGNGLPGSNVTLQIRGINSINAGRDPLYIIDGVPFSSQPLNRWKSDLAGANGFQSPFNSINPSDIESINILKDADATSIYGSRGANGVVLITTKKGKSGKTALDINYYNGIEKATNLIKGLNTEQYTELRKEAFNNDGVIPDGQNAPELILFDQHAYTDYQKLLIGNTAKVSDAQVSISGGNAYTRFLIRANYRKEGTIYYGNSRYKRGGVKIGIDHNSADNKFTTSVSAIFTADNNKGIPIPYNFNISPNFPSYTSSGAYNFIGGDSPDAIATQSIVSITKNLISNGQFKYKIIDGLSAQISLGYNFQTLNTLVMFPKASKEPTGYRPISEARYGNNTVETYIAEPQLNYNKKIYIGTFNALVGATWQYTSANGSFISGENYTNDNLLANLGSAGNISQVYAPASSSLQYKYASVFGRLNYNIADKYILNANFRRDGSSRFGPNKRYGNFGSGGIAWLFSKETFVKNILPVLSFGKLRLSYGVVGNDQILNYQYLATYSSGYNYQGTAGLFTSRIANPNYSWEINHKLDVGLELGFFDDRLLFSLSWFRNRTDNQLVGYPLPSQTGFTSYQANLPALVQNKGWEFSISSINIKSRYFKWESSFNLSFTDNKLLSFPGLAASSYANDLVVGQSLSILRSYKFTGINSQTGIPEFQTADGHTTNNPSYATDRFVIGKSIPDFFGGLNNSFSYKNFQFDFLFQFVKWQGWMPVYWPGFNRFEPLEALNRWRKPGDITDLPVAFTYQVDNDAAIAYFPFITSSRFWSDASFIRLKNLSVSYALPDNFVKKISFSKCRFYLQAQNLLTFTRYKGTDPELVSGQTFTIPSLKTITLGIQASF